MQYIFSRVGFKSWADQIRDTRNDDAFAKILSNVEKEAGFLFSDAATELYAEGLITKQQRDFGDVRFNEKTGQIEIKDQGTEIWSKGQDIVGKLGSEALDKLLWFHRLTETHQRRQMFRTAFHKNTNGYLKTGMEKKNL